MLLWLDDVVGEGVAADALGLHVGGKLVARIVGDIAEQVVEAAAVEHDAVEVILGQVTDDVEHVGLHVVVAGVEEAGGVVVAVVRGQVHTVGAAGGEVVDRGP